VVVSGPPASGKSTLAGPLADRLGVMVLSKDVIKEVLMDALPPAGVADSQQLGRAAMDVLFAIAAASPGAILENNWYAGLAGPRLARLGSPIVEVFCRCDPDLAYRRYRRRAGDRHPGHFDAVRDRAELYTPDATEPVAGGWPVIEVDTSRRGDPARLVDRIRAALDRAHHLRLRG